MTKILFGLFAVAALAGCGGGGGGGGSTPSLDRFVGSYSGTASRTTTPTALSDDYTSATASGTVQSDGRVVLIVTHQTSTVPASTITETVFATVNGRGQLSDISLLYSDTNGGSGGNGNPATGTLSLSGNTVTANVLFGTSANGQRYVFSVQKQ